MLKSTKMITFQASVAEICTEKCSLKRNVVMLLCFAPAEALVPATDLYIQKLLVELLVPPLPWLPLLWLPSGFLCNGIGVGFFVPLEVRLNVAGIVNLAGEDDTLLQRGVHQFCFRS